MFYNNVRVVSFRLTGGIFTIILLAACLASGACKVVDIDTSSEHGAVATAEPGPQTANHVDEIPTHKHPEGAQQAVQPTLRPTVAHISNADGSPVPEAHVDTEADSVPAPVTTIFPEPLISYFQASIQEADPGDTVILQWSATEAITVTLWRLMPTGQFGQWWDVEPEGSFEYNIKPHEKNFTRFTLFAAVDGDNSEMASLSITLRCLDTWFFDFAPDICPAAPALGSFAADQWFESGLMIWIEEEDQIYVLFDDGNSPGWSRYADLWDPGMPENDPLVAAPDGLYQPVRGFGALWREVSSVRDRLGWAIVEEAGFDTFLQRTSYARYNETYLMGPDGDIYRLLPERSGWEKISGA